MASMQAVMKELRTLKQEESAMMNLASKISDQLNRLKVEELALQNLVRLQNEDLERKSRGSRRSLPVVEIVNDNVGIMNELDDKEDKNPSNESIIPLNLVVNKFHQHVDLEEEEEDDDDDGDDDEIKVGKVQPVTNSTNDDIEQFVNSL